MPGMDDGEHEDQDPGEHDDELYPPSWAGQHTTCHHCGGHGRLPASYATLIDDQIVTTTHPGRPCWRCDGRGWLPGMVIPV